LAAAGDAFNVNRYPGRGQYSQNFGRIWSKPVARQRGSRAVSRGGGPLPGVCTPDAFAIRCFCNPLAASRQSVHAGPHTL